MELSDIPELISKLPEHDSDSYLLINLTLKKLRRLSLDKLSQLKQSALIHIDKLMNQGIYLKKLETKYVFYRDIASQEQRDPATPSKRRGSRQSCGDVEHMNFKYQFIETTPQTRNKRIISKS